MISAYVLATLPYKGTQARYDIKSLETRYVRSRRNVYYHMWFGLYTKEMAVIIREAG